VAWRPELNLNKPSGDSRAGKSTPLIASAVVIVTPTDSPWLLSVAAHSLRAKLRAGVLPSYGIPLDCVSRRNENEQEPSKEEEIADFNKLTLLAGKGDEEAFTKLLYERWDRTKQRDKHNK
jgi:hypothetical protein